jgi:hypothetical protein
VIDDDDAEATSSGSWKISSGEDPYGARSLYTYQVGATYAYESTLSGRYDVEMWWTRHNSRCTSVPVEIYDDGDLLETVYVNQQENGGQWNHLGTYDFSGQARLVVVADDSGCSTCADAVEFNPNSGSDPDPVVDNVTPIESQVIDDDDAEATSNGSWKISSGEAPYGARSLYTYQVGATYAYESTLSGRYDVAMWWTRNNSRCTSVPVEIYDDGYLLDTVYVNQQENGGQWNYLGTYDFSGQARLVVVADENGCSTCADAVQYSNGGN